MVGGGGGGGGDWERGRCLRREEEEEKEGISDIVSRHLYVQHYICKSIITDS